MANRGAYAFNEDGTKFYLGDTNSGLVNVVMANQSFRAAQGTLNEQFEKGITTASKNASDAKSVATTANTNLTNFKNQDFKSLKQTVNDTTASMLTTIQNHYTVGENGWSFMDKSREPIPANWYVTVDPGLYLVMISVKYDTGTSRVNNGVFGIGMKYAQKLDDCYSEPYNLITDYIMQPIDTFAQSSIYYGNMKYVGIVGLYPQQGNSLCIVPKVFKKTGNSSTISCEVRTQVLRLTKF